MVSIKPSRAAWLTLNSPDLIWCETGTPALAFAKAFAKAFADAIHAKFLGKLLSDNCSPSFSGKKT
jgi:isocitrate lyase